MYASFVCVFSLCIQEKKTTRLKINSRLTSASWFAQAAVEQPEGWGGRAGLGNPPPEPGAAGGAR